MNIKDIIKYGITLIMIIINGYLIFKYNNIIWLIIFCIVVVPVIVVLYLNSYDKYIIGGDE